MAGTTVFDGDTMLRALAEALAAVGVRASRGQADAVMGMPTAVAIAALTAEFRGHAAASPRTVEAVHADFIARTQWHYECHPKVVECAGASDLFAWCQQHGIRVGLDTDFSRDVAEAIIRRLCWRERGLIDAVVTGDDATWGRPHPEMIQRKMAATRLSEPSRVMNVGDTPADIQAGHAAVCRDVVGTPSGAHSALSLTDHAPTHLIAGLSELPCLFDGASAGAATPTGRADRARRHAGRAPTA